MTDLTLEDLIKVINERADYWIDLYNKTPLTDTQENSSDFAKGSYMSLIELKSYITHEQAK